MIYTPQGIFFFPPLSGGTDHFCNKAWPKNAPLHPHQPTPSKHRASFAPISLPVTERIKRRQFVMTDDPIVTIHKHHLSIAPFVAPHKLPVTDGVKLPQLAAPV